MSRIEWTICLLTQIVGAVEATRYPVALGAIIVSVLLPGLVIFSACFISIWLCCNWRRVPILRKQFDKTSKGTATPKAVPAAAYPHQAPVQYMPAPGEDKADNVDTDTGEKQITMEITPTQVEKEPAPV